MSCIFLLILSYLAIFIGNSCISPVSLDTKFSCDLFINNHTQTYKHIGCDISQELTISSQ